MIKNKNPDDADILQKVISLIKPLTDDDRARILETVITFLNIKQYPQLILPSNSENLSKNELIVESPFKSSEDSLTTPKDFIVQKQPQTNVERIACFAYYLTHYRNNPHFKTLDISKLNIEAAQPKFSNTAQAMKDAVRANILVPATKGNRQLSPYGEEFVRLLPDKAAAKSSLAKRPKRRSKKRKK